MVLTGQRILTNLLVTAWHMLPVEDSTTPSSSISGTSRIELMSSPADNTARPAPGAGDQAALRDNPQRRDFRVDARGRGAGSNRRP